MNAEQTELIRTFATRADLLAWARKEAAKADGNVPKMLKALDRIRSVTLAHMHLEN